MRVNHSIFLLLAAGAAAGLTGCAGMTTKPLNAIATLEPRSGSTVTGVVKLRERDGRVQARVELSGLAASSVHGFHVHDKGDCTAPDATSAGGHFNPGSVAHGDAAAAIHHAGDLPSVRADAAGRVRVDFDLGGVTLSAGPTSIIGRSFIVHRDADDYTTQPSGNSGPRVACGVIGAK
jgi:Cu-Zn family superoxide dismutase